MRKIAVIFRDWSSDRSESISGVFEFANRQTDLLVGVFNHVQNAAQFSAPLEWGADGIICCLDGATQTDINSLLAVGLPTVNVGSVVEGMPSVTVSPTSIVGLLAEHILAINPTKIIVAADVGHRLLVSNVYAWGRTNGRPVHWLNVSRQPRDLLHLEPVPVPEFLPLVSSASGPIAIIAANDCVADYIDRISGALPELVENQLTIFSARDSPQCVLSGRAISAVVAPDRQLGFEAASVLSRMLHGKPISGGVSHVNATEFRDRKLPVAASDDSLVPIALEYIRQHAATGITVGDVMDFLQWRLSRVTFERHFRCAVGSAPGEEIRRLRLEHAKELLLTTKASIAEISGHCGFESVSGFSTFFRNGTNASPSEFRRLNNNS
ncbi:helix-turn-helix domain-containing protein [Fuerstiella marisgermanici]|uniref:Xylose operon regulatory protein n=1 Tax=Fuerstiella marisgermanici TaxID=1891926 RepID=A0A1P8WAK5_9PLAN|nr:helix-turn-helix domain-containing protein [Fuerstiella marisgermanici]APZ91096.1 Xylose operon regulatory protein [Fuerstiella marisgermanici]